MSTFTVKADVHRAESFDSEPVSKPVSKKKYFDKNSSKSELDLSAADDIRIIASEDILSPQATEERKQKREKPRWSLRIKLNSSEDNYCANGNVSLLYIHNYLIVAVQYNLFA